MRIDVRRSADDRTVHIGEHDRTTSLDDGGGLRGHDVGAQIELARRNADHCDQDRGDEADHHNLQVGGAICGVEGRVHGAEEITSDARRILYLRTIPLYQGRRREGATRSAADNPNWIRAVGRLLQARHAGALYPNVVDGEGA